MIAFQSFLYLQVGFQNRGSCHLPNCGDLQCLRKLSGHFAQPKMKLAVPLGFSLPFLCCHDSYLRDMNYSKHKNGTLTETSQIDFPGLSSIELCLGLIEMNKLDHSELISILVTTLYSPVCDSRLLCIKTDE